MNLKSYITSEDYYIWAGPDWPSFNDLLNNNYTVNAEIQKEVDHFITLHLDKGTVFPIRTATACQRTWTESIVWLNELSVSGCQRITPIKFAIEDFENFHNLPRKIADRNTMLQGKWPDNGCSSCKDIEALGGISDRLQFINYRGYAPIELENNPAAVEVSPRILQIWAQNTCNMSCIYCNSKWSSQIEQENLEFGEFNSGDVQIPILNLDKQTTQAYFDLLAIWLDKNVTTLARLVLLGGETFLQHQLMTVVLDVLERHPNANLEFCMYSNLNVPDTVWNRYVPKILELQKRRHIKWFDLMASIDCWGPEQEYVRSGLDLEKLEQRFAWCADQDPNGLKLNVNQTITSMTIKTMPDLIKKIKQYSKNRPITQYFNCYIGPHTFQHPKIFAYTMWEKDFEEILKIMPTDSGDQQQARERMVGVQLSLQQSVDNNNAEIKKLHVYLDEIDRRRGTDWQKLFSYLKI